MLAPGRPAPENKVGIAATSKDVNDPKGRLQPLGTLGSTEKERTELVLNLTCDVLEPCETFADCSPQSQFRNLVSHVAEL